MVVAFILSRRNKNHLSQAKSFHKPHSANPFVKAIRGALDILPLLRDHFTLEIGSEGGSGSLGLRDCIRTDLVPLPGLDVVCDATALPFRDQVFERSWGVYLAHHVVDINPLISEARRVSEKLFLFDFLPNSYIHYYSKIWDWLIFNTRIKAVNPQVLSKIDPNYRSYKRSHLGTILYVF
jgi:hypothetical protein